MVCHAIDSGETKSPDSTGGNASTTLSSIRQRSTDPKTGGTPTSGSSSCGVTSSTTRCLYSRMYALSFYSSFFSSPPTEPLPRARVRSSRPSTQRTTLSFSSHHSSLLLST